MRSSWGPPPNKCQINTAGIHMRFVRRGEGRSEPLLIHGGHRRRDSHGRCRRSGHSTTDKEDQSGAEFNRGKGSDYRDRSLADFIQKPIFGFRQWRRRKSSRMWRSGFTRRLTWATRGCHGQRRQREERANVWKKLFLLE